MTFAFQLVQLNVGLALYGLALALQVRAVLGVASWTVLVEGLERVFPLSFGVFQTIVSLTVLLLWFPLRLKPGIGTLLNAVLVGPAADIALDAIPPLHSEGSRVCVFIAGLILLAAATVIYIAAGLGSGARDGLMLGLHQQFRWPLWVARLVIELSVLTGGWLLGGNVGIGTIIAAVAIGPLVQALMPISRHFPWSHEKRPQTR